MEKVMAAVFTTADLVANLLVNLFQGDRLVTRKKSLLEEVPHPNWMGFIRSGKVLRRVTTTVMTG